MASHKTISVRNRAIQVATDEWIRLGLPYLLANKKIDEDWVLETAAIYEVARRTALDYLRIARHRAHKRLKEIEILNSSNNDTSE